MLRWLKSSRDGVARLGPLELQLLRTLWQRGDATVRELLDDAAFPAAYTTVMTTLDRLYKKGLLDRALEGRAFRYRPNQTEEEYNRRNLADGLKSLLDSAGDPSAPLSFLVDTVAQHDARLLDELERAVGRKRQKLGTRRGR